MLVAARGYAGGPPRSGTPINATVHLSGRVGGALPGRKVLTLVHAMAAGGWPLLEDRVKCLVHLFRAGSRLTGERERCFFTFITSVPVDMSDRGSGRLRRRRRLRRLRRLRLPPRLLLLSGDRAPRRPDGLGASDLRTPQPATPSDRALRTQSSNVSSCQSCLERSSRPVRSSSTSLITPCRSRNPEDVSSPFTRMSSTMGRSS